MKSIGAAAADAEKAARHRKFHWCRLRNDFIDMALWRVVAAAVGLQLTQVQAFVARLDILANKSIPRGYVGDFDAAEFGAAHDMPAADCARLFAALEERGWIEQERLTTFWERNPDKDDASAGERKARERAFKGALRELARLTREGLIGVPERTRREIAIFALRDQGRHGLLTWAEQQPKLAGLMHLSTGHASHNVTDRDIVTVTPRAEQILEEQPVDNFGHGARGAAAELSEEEKSAAQAIAAEAWLQADAVRIVTERMKIPSTLAATKILRWQHQELGGDALALRDIIEKVDRAGYVDVRFHSEVSDAVARFPRQAQRVLALPVPLKGVGHG